MGLDLKLIPVDHDSFEWGFGHSLIEVGWAGDLYDTLTRLKLTDPPKDFTTFIARGADGESTYGQTQETPYGDPLKCALAQAVARAMRKEVDESWQRTAARAYLEACPPDMRVALYWH